MVMIIYTAVHRVLRKLSLPVAAVLVLLMACGCSSGKEDTASGSQRLHDMMEFWNTCHARGDMPLLIRETRHFLDSALACGDSVSAIYSAISLAQGFIMEERMDSAKAYLDIIDSRYGGDRVRLPDPRLEMVLYNIRGHCALKEDIDYSYALSCFMKSYEYAQACGDDANSIIMLSNIVCIYFSRQDGNGLEYAELALQKAENMSTGGFPLCIAYISMAEMLYLNGDIDGAFGYIGKARELADAGDMYSSESVINLIYAELYYARGEIGEAEKFFNASMASVESSEPAMVSLLFLRYGKFCEDNGFLEKAERLYREGLDISLRHKNVEFRRELFLRLSELAWKMGDREMAFSYFVQYRKHIDTVALARKEQELANLQQLYLKMRHENEMQAKELELMHARKKIMYAVASAVIGLLVLVFVFFWVMRQHRMYKTLVLQYRSYIDRLEAEKSDMFDGAHGGGDAADRKSQDRQLFLQIESVMKDGCYREKDMSIDRMARLVGSNRVYVSRAINSFTGGNFYKYLDSYRIREATRLISDRENKAPFKQISEDVGYGSISVFYKAFKRETGCTPAIYRSQIIRMQDNPDAD